MDNTPFYIKDILDKISDAVLVVDKNFCIRYANEKATGFFQLPPGKLEGKNILNDISLFVDPVFLETMQQSFQKQQSQKVQLYFPPAGSLSLAITTISTYRSRILKKLGLQSNAELTRYAIAYI